MHHGYFMNANEFRIGRLSIWFSSAWLYVNMPEVLHFLHWNFRTENDVSRPFFCHFLLHDTLRYTLNTSILQWFSYCIPGVPEVKNPLYCSISTISRTAPLFIPYLWKCYEKFSEMIPLVDFTAFLSRPTGNPCTQIIIPLLDAWTGCSTHAWVGRVSWRA